MGNEFETVKINLVSTDIFSFAFWHVALVFYLRKVVCITVVCDRIFSYIPYTFKYLNCDLALLTNT